MLTIGEIITTSAFTFIIGCFIRMTNKDNVTFRWVDNMGDMLLFLNLYGWATYAVVRLIWGKDLITELIKGWG